MSDGIFENVVSFFRDWEEIEIIALENHRGTILETFIAVEPHVEPKDACAFALCICVRLVNLHLPETERQKMVELFANNLPRILASGDDFRDTLEIVMGCTGAYSASFTKNTSVSPYIDQVHAMVQNCVENPTEKVAPTRLVFDQRLTHAANPRLVH